MKDRQVAISFVAGVILLASLPGCATTGAGDTNQFPKQLHGVWDLGPEPCVLPVNPDADSPIRITASSLQAYEHVDTPTRVRQVSSLPSAWLVSARVDIAPGIETELLYVVRGEYLTVTNGQDTKQYRLCR